MEQCGIGDGDGLVADRTRLPASSLELRPDSLEIGPKLGDPARDPDRARRDLVALPIAFHAR